MLKVALPIFAAVSFAVGGGLFLVDAQTPKPVSQGWDLSIREAARTMGIELTADCLKAIALHVQANGFDRGVVSNRGSVLIRDANGRDTWVCA